MVYDCFIHTISFVLGVIIPFIFVSWAMWGFGDLGVSCDRVFQWGNFAGEKHGKTKNTLW